MIELGTATEVVFSPCEKYRYWLSREWDDSEGKTLGFIMLNPSTADAVKNDPTVERCMRRAKMLGYGGFVVVNLFAYRATDPKDMLSCQDPVGPENNTYIIRAAHECEKLVCAWGVHGRHQDRCYQVMGFLEPFAEKIHCLGETKEGFPRHPLYTGYDTPLIHWKM